MLTGYRVLDCSNQMGWLAGRVLADLGADVIKIEPPETPTDDPEWQAYNINKRLIVTDLQSEAGKETFNRITAAMDIIIVCTQPGSKTECLFDYEQLSQKNPNLILVRITPFGGKGPRAHWQATDIELMAASGAMSLAGEPDSTPVRITVPQSYCWAGLQAAVAGLMALNARRILKRGQEVSVSAQASILPALAFAPINLDMTGLIPTRAGSFAPGRSVMGAKYRAFWPCKDGYLNFILYGGNAGRRTNKQLLAWMHECHLPVGVLEQIDWDSFDPVKTDQEQIDSIEEPIARFFTTLTKREFLEQASKREILGYPVFTVNDIANDPQLQARQFWNDVPAGGGKKQRHCGVFYMVDNKRPTIRYPLSAGASDVEEILRELGSDNTSSDPCTDINQQDKPKQALDGIKVVEFGGYAAGPQLGKILANFGATVVHVESPNRPDGFRLEYPPFKDGKPGLNRGGCFAYFNDSKYAVTLDVKKPGGLELARKLVDWADIVVENMRPGVMERIGLGYDTVKKTNPGLVMLSTCNMGQTGPRANTPGFGSQLSALAGFSHLTGRSDGPPMLLYGPYIDFIAANFGAAAVLAALESSKRTGKGVNIDISQYETGLLFIAGALLSYHVNGEVANRGENFDPVAVPHGAYRCRDNNWLALSCWSDEEFKCLAGVIKKNELLDDPRFTNKTVRKVNEEALNSIIKDWSKDKEVDAAACSLQDAGVHAYMVNTIADVFTDPQLQELDVWQWRDHPVMGKQVSLFPPFQLFETPGHISTAAPLFGGDNDLVFQQILGLSKEQYEELRRHDVIGANTLDKSAEQQSAIG